MGWAWNNRLGPSRINSCESGSLLGCTRNCSIRLTMWTNQVCNISIMGLLSWAHKQFHRFVWAQPNPIMAGCRLNSGRIFIEPAATIAYHTNTSTWPACIMLTKHATWTFNFFISEKGKIQYPMVGGWLRPFFEPFRAGLVK